MPDQTEATITRYRDAVLACAVMNFRQMARAVTAHYDAQLRPAGLRATQLNLLMAIESEAATTVTDLAEILAMDRTTLTRNLKLLRDRGPRRYLSGKAHSSSSSRAWAGGVGRPCSTSCRRPGHHLILGRRDRQRLTRSAAAVLQSGN